jgi:RNA polymerase sigma factor (TIGR02999 family)
MAKHPQITQLLVEMSGGNQGVLDKLIPLVYEELRLLAHHHLKRERPDHTLNTTALVHEAYIKLVDQRRVQWQNRGHFFGIASMAMRRILVSHARGRKRAKRGGGAARLSLEAGLTVASNDRDAEILAVDEALTRLAGINERAAKVVEFRFFGGLTIEDTAVALGVAPMTVKRDWLMAKTWLRREI